MEEGKEGGDVADHRTAAHAKAATKAFRRASRSCAAAEVSWEFTWSMYECVDESEAFVSSAVANSGSA
jgi:hypothetical protein